MLRQANGLFDDGRQPFSILGLSNKASTNDLQPAQEPTDQELPVLDVDMQAELKLVVKGVKKKLTYEELDDHLDTPLDKPAEAETVADAAQKNVRNSTRIAARQQ